MEVGTVSMTKSVHVWPHHFGLEGKPRGKGETWRARATQCCCPLASQAPLLQGCGVPAAEHRDRLCMPRKADSLLSQNNNLLKNSSSVLCWTSNHQVTPVYLCSPVQGSAGIRHLGWFSDSEPPAIVSNTNKNQIYKQKCKCMTWEASRLMSRRRTFLPCFLTRKH